MSGNNPQVQTLAVCLLIRSFLPRGRVRLPDACFLIRGTRVRVRCERVCSRVMRTRDPEIPCAKMLINESK